MEIITFITYPVFPYKAIRGGIPNGKWNSLALVHQLPKAV